MSATIKVQVNAKELRRLQRALNPKLYAQAQVNALNAVARVVHTTGERNIKQKLIVRAPRYTLGSLRMSPAKVRSSGAAGYAEVGSISPYLPLQETGGRVRPRRRGRLAVPTVAGRGGSWLRAIPPRLRVKAMRGQRRFFTLPAGPRLRQPGIFTRRGKRLLMVRGLGFGSVRVPASHWHTDAVKQFGKQHIINQVFIREARKLLGAIK